MFGTIRKHQSWLWIVIIVAMIIGLVAYFGPGNGRGGNQGSSEGNFGSIEGERINKTDFLNAQREAYLAYFLSTGQWPDSSARANFDPERETYQRLFFIKKIQDQNIQVDSDSVAQAARNILTQFGKGSPIPLDIFVERALMPRATAEDFERYLRHELALRQLITIIGIGGDLVTPQEAQALYIRENQEIAAEAVFFSGTNYQTSVATPTLEVLKQFYTNQASEYRVPERVQVSYISFEATNYLTQVERDSTNLAEQVNMQFAQLGTNYTEIAKTPEEAKVKIREMLLHREALGVAYKKANEFASKLFDQEPMRAENLTALAKADGLKVKTSAPFNAKAGPTDLEGGANFAKEAFKLNAEEPLAGPVIGENAVYVIALAKKIPSEVPAFETLRERVTADYKHTQATITARRAGNDFARSVTNGLASGKSFAAICADAKVKPVSLPPFSMSTSKLPQLGEHASLYQFFQVAFETPPGKASDFSVTDEGGFVVYVEKQLPTDQAKLTAEMPDFLKRIRQARRQEAINAWLQREGSKALRDTPLMQPKPALAPGQARS